jgi:hypothetical protein
MLLKIAYVHTCMRAGHVAPIARIAAIHGAICHGLDNRRR